VIEIFLFMICAFQIVLISYVFQLNKNIVILNENLIKIAKHYGEKGWRNI